MAVSSNLSRQIDPQEPESLPEGTVTIRDATEADLAAVTDLDALNTGLAKPDYWQARFAETAVHGDRHFLIAETVNPNNEPVFAGFIVGEIRAWEFGSEPCGWVHSIGVYPGRRVSGIGTRLFDSICERFRADGVRLVRTMLAREDQLNMSFFRSQGMMAGAFIELEKPID